MRIMNWWFLFYVLRTSTHKLCPRKLCKLFAARFVHVWRCTHLRVMSARRLGARLGLKRVTALLVVPLLHGAEGLRLEGGPVQILSQGAAKRQADYALCAHGGKHPF